MAIPRSILLTLCLATSLAARAHHPPDKADGRWVVARVPVTDGSELARLASDHELWSFVWRQGHAVIRADPDHLPANAEIDWDATSRLPDRHHPGPMVKGAAIPGYACYRTVEQTHADLEALAVQHPDLAEWVDYGDSWLKTQDAGGHDLQALVLTNRNLQPGTDDPAKPVLMIMAAMHAREYATAEVATRLAEYLVDRHGEDADVTWLLDHHAIHILPQHNPDGRKRAEAGTLWRKNVNDAYCGIQPSAIGADLNRNASTLFWSAGASACSETYPGPVPGSEPESAAIEAYIRAVFPDQRDGGIDIGAPDTAQGLFISLHSFGEYVFYPWEGVDDDTGNEAGYRALSQRLAAANGYAACQNCCLGTARGTTVDFAYEETGVAALTFELGTTFFQDCASFDSTIWPDNRDALLYAARAARRPYRSSLGPELGVPEAVDNADGSHTLIVDVVAGNYLVQNPCPMQSIPDPVVSAADVALVRYSIDTPIWDVTGTPLAAQDGAFDSSVETAEGILDTEGWTPGRYRVYLQAEDAAGHRGPVRAVVIEILPLFSDGFEAEPP